MSEDPRYDFDPAFQLKIVSLLARDTTFAMRTKDLIEPSFFTETAVATFVDLIQNHIKVYKMVPDVRVLPQVLKDAKLAGRIRSEQIDDLKAILKTIMSADLSNPEYVTDKVADFARHQAIERGMMASIPLLEKGKFEEIAEIMKKSLAIGVSTESEDYDYFLEIENRTKEREDILAGRVVRDGITTGYKALDPYLYHAGWGRKELSCIMGAAKAGKSMSLGDFAKNASLAGYNVLYDSLEVSGKIIASRIDAALSDTMIKELNIKSADVEAAVKKAHIGAGHFKMKDHPSGTLKPSGLVRVIEQYRAEGIVLDLVAVDYADIMAAEYRSDALTDNLRSIYIDLRAIAQEYNVAMLTATQTNRDGAKSAAPKATDIGDDWNKARTVDILIGISATEAEKAAGEARLSWLLSRNTEDGFAIKIRQNRAKMQFLTGIIGRV